MHSRIKRINDGGFTIVEILVVITIIVILFLLLFPSISSMKRSAESAKCVSNLRQIGIALLSYSSDHNGLIPPHLGKDPDTGKYITAAYWYRVLGYDGYLEKIVAGKGIYFCPSLPVTHDGMQAYGLRRWATPGQPFDTTQNLRILTKPSDFFLVADSYVVPSKSQGYFIAGGDPNWCIRLEHFGLANTLFADGHVAGKSREYFESLSVLQAEYSGSKPYHFWKPNL